MKWTRDTLTSLNIPAGKSKLTIRDSMVPGLYFEVRARSKNFIFRYFLSGKQGTVKLGRFPELTIDDAREMALAMRSQVSEGVKPRLGTAIVGVTLGEFFFGSYVAFSKRHHKETRSLVLAFQNHIQPTLGGLRFEEIDKKVVYAWQESLIDKDLKPSTVNKISILLGQVVKLAFNLSVPGAKPRSDLGFRMMKLRPTHNAFLSPGQIATLKKAISNSTNAHLQKIVDLLILTGARKREALDARWIDVDFSRKIWTVPMSKNGLPRQIHLSDGAANVLKSQFAITGNSYYVFPNPKTRQPYACIFHSWDKARKEAGLDQLRIHDLRHSFASTLVNKGVPLYDVQKLLGHQNIVTTQRYAHLSTERLQSVVSIMDEYVS